MDVINENLEKIVTDVANKLKLTKWTFTTNSRNMVNYMGKFISLNIRDELNGNENRILIKYLPQIVEFEKVFNEIYTREAYVYTVLMPIYKSLNSTVNLESIFPQCYYASNDQNMRLLLLQDMTQQGYQRYVGEYLDYQHMSISLNAVAQFHALSFISFEKKVIVSKSNVMRPFLRDDPKEYMDYLKYASFKYVKLFDNAKYAEYLKGLMDNFDEIFDNSSLKARRQVYGHGDLWKENFIFKYANQTPIGVCILDFQTTRLLSPAYDVLYLILSGSKVRERYENYNDLIALYYGNLEKTLQDNNLNPQEVYSLEDFHADLKLAYPVCVLMTFFAFVAWIGLEDVESVKLQEDKPLSPEVRQGMERELRERFDGFISDVTNLGYIAL